MRLLVCGGRDYTDKRTIFLTLSAYHKADPITTLIHGAARGADSIAAEWATLNGVEIAPFPAKWELGKGAGLMRNQQMLAALPDMVIAFFPGGNGTKHMCKIAHEAGLDVILIDFKVTE